MNMSGGMDNANRLLWKYGTRYAKTIKSIPFLKYVAEKHYWRLVKMGGGPPTRRNTERRDMLYLGDYRALTRTVFGHKMFVDTRDRSITPHICLDGFWEMHVVKLLLKMIGEGMSVVEIGANIGCHSIPIAASLGKKGRVYCFEANPHIFDLLHQNFAVNGFLERAVLCNKAVSRESGRREFHISMLHHGEGTLGKIEDERASCYRDETTTVEVETTSLDEYFADETVRIDVMKMDAQGSEPLIFGGMKRILTNNPKIKIVCEFEPACISAIGEDPKEFIEEIVNNGFRIHIIRPDSKTERVSPSDLSSIRHCDLFLDRG